MAIEKPKPFKWEHDAYNNNYEDCGLTGYTGLDYHTVARLSVMPAARSQIGTRGFFKAGLAELPNGDLIVNPFNMTDKMERIPGTQIEASPVHLHKSKDGGRTWQPIEDHTPLYGNEASIVCLPNGELLMMSQQLPGIAWSGDEGKTWEVTLFDTEMDAPYQLWATIRNVIQHPDGTVSFMRCLGAEEGRGPGEVRKTKEKIKALNHQFRHATSAEEQHQIQEKIKELEEQKRRQRFRMVDVEDEFRDGSEPKCRAWLYHSTDGGRTWPDRTEIETWDHSFTLFAEADFCRLPDGRILATSRVEWTHPLAGKPLPYPPVMMPNDHAAGHMTLLESADEGRTWTEPREFLQYSEVHGQLTLLRDGRLLCTYANYHLPFGVAAVMSDDCGATWDFDHPFQLALSNGHNAGWATTRQLQDGTLLTVYGLEPYHIEPRENGRTVCHCVRWQIGAS